MTWKINDENDYRITSVSSWLFIWNHENLPDACGVYLFADANHHIKYAGKTCSGTGMHAEIRSAIKRNKDYGATKIKVLYTMSNERALSLEKDLINKYKPLNNHK